ncbi:MAG TPA: 4Fe-4S dicluster domain-containing protein [Candidatus Sulfomarinibacteraceae bacterium]|nr:4Fe-4S dicluster domain-containing protein [Candidatus Sulfomarinibacteraceae bacterium]
MTTQRAEPGSMPARFLPRERLDDLLAALGTGGRRVVGPAVSDGAIIFMDLQGAADLPAGWTLRSVPGRVRLERLPDGPAAARTFHYPVSGEGIKRFTFPGRVDALSTETADDGTVRVRVEAPAEPVPLAVVGARACDLAALAVHDRVLAGGPAVDPDYAARRRDLLVVAIECAVAASTCFCSSMGTGPEVTTGADLVLGELDDGFVVRASTGAGERVIAPLGLAAADPLHAGQAAAELAATRASIGTGAVPAEAREVLLANLEHPRWDAVAERCIACANCTLACPTCFCTGVTVESGFDGRASGAVRRWDSCFTEGFAQVAGGSFRPRHRDRYRQWLTHKFATWWDQFGTSGCIGCGRCIAWCPVGIDIRDELHAIAGTLPGPADSRISPPAPASRSGLMPDRARHPLPQVSPDALEFTPASVVSFRPETADTTTLRLTTTDPGILAGRPGQFLMVGVPAFPIPPISISRFHADGVELTIRAAGAATSFLTKLRAGSGLALRGPLGRGWPIEDAAGRDVVIVAGGIGLAPLRPVIDAVIRDRDRYADIRLYLGARTPRDRLFVEEIDALAAREDILVRVTVDRAGPEWLGRVGIVTQLFKTVQGTGADATAFICGPERMMTATADVLGDLGVPREHTWVTLERHMECGVGLCGHCQLGSHFVCRDGPVFSIAELGEDLRLEGR